MRDEVEIMTAGKHKRFLQFNYITLGVCTWACPKKPNNKFAISLQYLKKKVKDEVVFCLWIKVKGFLKLILSF